jgi:hypothetical protein
MNCILQKNIIKICYLILIFHTLRSSTQNGIKQHPQKHPNTQSAPAASHASKPVSFSTLVTIDC